MNETKIKEDAKVFIDAIVKSFAKDVPEQLKSLTYQFFAKLPLIDIERIDAKQAVDMVASSYEFLQDRTLGIPKIRVTAKKSSALIEILNDDMPFLVDSVIAELSRQNININQVIHPIVKLERDLQGKLISLGESANSAESFIRIETSRLPDSLSEAKIIADLELVLANVRLAVADWKPMCGKIEESIGVLRKSRLNFPVEEINEVCDFLEWLEANNFVLLGHIEYDFYDANGNNALSVVPNSELGIFRSDDNNLKPKGLQAIPQEIRHFALVPQLIEITKSMRKSKIHRLAHMDYIGLKRFDENGKVIGERRFIGLFTSNVYYQSAKEIPVIRHKISRVIERAAFNPESYDGKTLRAILEFTPRDELFQFAEDDLFDYAMGVLSLEARPGVRLFLRRDSFERFVSCVVFMPRERFNGALREEIQKILAEALNGSVSEFFIQMTDAPLMRMQVIITTTPTEVPQVDVLELEDKISKITHRWSEALFAALAGKFGEESAGDMLRIYANAFPKAYIGDHDASVAIYDIQKINDVIASGTPSLDIFHNKNDAGNFLHLKWYNPTSQIPLSDVLPILENMGFKVIDEQPYLVKPAGVAISQVWIRDLLLSIDDKAVARCSTNEDFEKLGELLGKIWQNESETDALDALVLNAGLNWRQVVLIRAYSKYMKQIGFAYGLDTIAGTLNSYPTLAKLIAELFEARFNPHETIDCDGIIKNIEKQCENVGNITDEIIIRRFVDLINATMRTNYFQADKQGKTKSYISFKFASPKIPELPLPHPYAEIFVYSRRIEGIHLRGGKVARGGLRWSDRRDDFRTEVLGLVKAQMVKNTVIVPVGSKGGFVLKQAPSGREEFMAEGVACYKTFLSGLLDLTDNIVDGNIVPPSQVVRHDDNDPYLVVAADKGTATFSDYANAVSAEYGFWLGDAFASGGSVGYDHKKMAITAKGGFVSVERHFREIGVDIHSQDFSVVGIGDMAGDVFGNGMLLSKHIRLVAAFNHMHIFLDPSPDSAKSFVERQRMFNLPRSSWTDYDKSLISQGGGIFERSQKSIALTVEVKQMIGSDKDAMSPDELIRALLKAEVDLLWNGGIGTYVKAEDETHEQVGDRANNNLRINGKDLRCKVIGEGGNLGFTQKGRIEYAKIGGRLNTDAIDNSAGVDCSDHEVNIKIGLGSSVASGKLSQSGRDELLASMTDEVADLVLQDNILQSQIITITESQSQALLEDHLRLMESLERSKKLDRAVEFLPSNKQAAERKNEGRGLTRPELSVLLAYSKMSVYEELLKSKLPDDNYFSDDLLKYFPTRLQKDFASELLSHPLKREIIATIVTNEVINRTGITFIHNIAEDSGRNVADVAYAYYPGYRDTL
ncbi:MAG: NAD-glutamate dehydrogenase, partial [Pseudomonadota bacterium]